MSIREEITSLNELFKLKETYRFSQVKDRKESTAEHTWGCLVVADYLLKYVQQDLDRLHIYEILMYHDLVEAECGDIPLLDEQGRVNKQEIEQQAAKTLAKRLPEHIAKKFLARYEEYETAATPEAKFCHIVDAFESDSFYGMYPPKRHVIDSDAYDIKRITYLESFPGLRKHYDELKKLRVEDGIIDD